MMDNEFDSGDDLFDGLDEQELLQSTDQVQGQKRKRSSENDDSPDARALQDINPNSIKRRKSSELPYLAVESNNPPAIHKASYLALARRLLAEKFGYGSFRHEQEAAIQQVLAGKNTLVNFPTGAGKSLCYQIPAIAFPELDEADPEKEEGSSGVTIVVSPLIALMKDQVDALKKRGIPADCMDSSKTWDEIQIIQSSLREGKLRMLYCAPERLNNEGFVANMKHVPGGVRLVAVDEAHCISEWGHSFRPEYLKVARFVEEVKAERVICLTATATPKVSQDICKAFNIQDSCVFRTPSYRPNLQLHAKTVDSEDANEKWEDLFQFLRSHQGSTLIYVALQEQAESHAMTLRKQGFKAQAFHAGMKAEEKHRIQDDFMASRIPIVCATIAFGMGIDKADIRNIIHWDLSSTIEEYSQQIGRAGRDGKTSHCMYYISPGSFYMRENFARGDLPSRHSLKLLLLQLFTENGDLRVNDVLKASHYGQSRDFDIRASPLAIIYATLELHHGLIRAITPEYSKHSFEAMPSYYVVVKSDKSQEAQAIWSGSVKKAKLFHIDATMLSRERGLNRNDLVNKLHRLNDHGHIKLKVSGVENRYRVLKELPRTEPEIDKLADKLFADLAAREQDALSRAQDVMALVTGARCFALALAEHFGMGLPDRKTSCGHCTYCNTGEPVRAPLETKHPTTPQSIKSVLAATDVRDDPRFLARVAFGIKSPRVTALKLDKSSVFRSLAHHDFGALVREFTKACDAANRQT